MFPYSLKPSQFPVATSNTNVLINKSTSNTLGSVAAKTSLGVRFITAKRLRNWV